MREAAVRVVTDYVKTYADELSKLEFEPEREFETLLEDEQVLISGAIDVIRRDDPPQVTLVDFKSGDTQHDNAVKLDSEEMKLQVSLYGIAARAEIGIRARTRPGPLPRRGGSGKTGARGSSG